MKAYIVIATDAGKSRDVAREIASVPESRWPMHVGVRATHLRPWKAE